MGLFNAYNNTRGALHNRAERKRIKSTILHHQESAKRLIEVAEASRTNAELKFSSAQKACLEKLQQVKTLLDEMPIELTEDVNRTNKPEVFNTYNRSIDKINTRCSPINLLETGAKAATGPVTALAAYAAVSALGTASTGAAIGGLSGAAASSATLAWFGGGALAAGGGGILLGSTIIGSIAIFPVMLVSADAANKYYKNKLEADQDQLQLIRGELRIIKQKCNHAESVCERVDKKSEILSYCLDRLDRYESVLLKIRETTGSLKYNLNERNYFKLQACKFSVNQIEAAVVNTISHEIVDTDYKLTSELPVVLEETDPGIFIHKWVI